MNKPHIKIDAYNPTEYICVSVRLGPGRDWLGRVKAKRIRGWGHTPAEAYAERSRTAAAC